jgi:hypothetical protein
VRVGLLLRFVICGLRRAGVVLATDVLGCRDDHLRFGRGAWRPEEGLPEHVVAVGCHSVLRVGTDRVVAGPAEDVVPIAVAHEEDIVAVASARPFVLVAAKEEAVVSTVAGEVVPAGPTIQKVVVSAGGETIVAIGAEQDLISCGASIDPGAIIRYGAGENDSRITVGRTRATPDLVGAAAAPQEVSAVSARDLVPLRSRASADSGPSLPQPFYAEESGSHRANTSADSAIAHTVLTTPPRKGNGFTDSIGPATRPRHYG